MCPDTDPPSVPPELLDQLRGDTQAFSAARQHLESALDASMPETGELHNAENEFRRAEGRLEDTTTKIDAVFHKPGKPDATHIDTPS